MSESNSVVTPECRLSFPNLFKPEKNTRDDGTVVEQFGASFLFPLGADLGDMKALVLRTAEAEFGDDALALLKDGTLHNPIKDQGKKRHLTGYTEGSYISAISKSRPGVVKLQDGALVDVIDPAEVFPGLIVRASLRAYAFTHRNPQGKVMKRGVSFGLNNVLIVRDDGTRWDNRTDAAQDFAAFGKPPSTGGAASKGDLF